MFVNWAAGCSVRASEEGQVTEKTVFWEVNVPSVPCLCFWADFARALDKFATQQPRLRQAH